ncbi:MAG: transcription termination/antitermination protein NusG [Candidatus Promineifilaceae bacterium]|jgi:transcription elongation factor/antiterminator RfaH
MKQAWYALRVKPYREKSVRQRLEAEGLEAYLPLVRVQPVNPRSAKVKAYFPGYIFVHADLKHLGMNKLNWMPGALGLVEFGGIAAVVPDNLIHEIRQLVEQINEAGGLTRFELAPGDRVRIVEGPFAGYEAIFDTHLPDKDRVQVLLAFLSQSPQPVQLSSDAVEKLKR